MRFSKPRNPCSLCNRQKRNKQESMNPPNPVKSCLLNRKQTQLLCFCFSNQLVTKATCITTPSRPHASQTSAASVPEECYQPFPCQHIYFRQHFFKRIKHVFNFIPESNSSRTSGTCDLHKIKSHNHWQAHDIAFPLLALLAQDVPTRARHTPDIISGAFRPQCMPTPAISETVTAARTHGSRHIYKANINCQPSLKKKHHR